MIRRRIRLYLYTKLWIGSRSHVCQLRRESEGVGIGQAPLQGPIRSVEISRSCEGSPSDDWPSSCTFSISSTGGYTTRTTSIVSSTLRKVALLENLPPAVGVCRVFLEMEERRRKQRQVQ